MKTHLLPTSRTPFTATGISPRHGRRSLFLAAVLAAAPFAVSGQNESTGPTVAPESSNTTEAVPDVSASLPALAEGAGVGGISTNGGLKLNFRNAPIDLVLNHLSEAAGFIIEMDTNVRGNVSVISSHAMTKDEVVDLLNSVLHRNGYAAIRTGDRTLKIMDLSSAKLRNLVRIGNEPSAIPNNDETVTQIIPIRYVEAGQLVSDISPFVSPNATIIANQAGNSIVITDTQANIRHLLEIIKAIDSSAEDVTEVKVFRLRYADPTEMATLLAGLFPDQSGTAQSPIRFGNRGGGRGGGGFGGGGFGGGGFNPFAAAFGRGGAAPAAGGQTDRIRKRNQVVAVADARTSTVVVTATRDLMEQITEMVEQLDNPGKAQRMQVIRISNADPSEVLAVLQDTVGATTSRNTRNQTSPFQTRIQQNQNSTATGNTGFGQTGTQRGGQRGGGF
jgi:type II secretory pathway component GspD/PulD (secretin)